jgi:hypothetical protein
MITLRDCVDLAGIEPDEIDAVAEHERLPFIVAMEKGSWMLEQSWGPPAIRQMIQDDVAAAAAHGAWRHVDELMVTYHVTCHRLPEGQDRRRDSRH